MHPKRHTQPALVNSGGWEARAISTKARDYTSSPRDNPNVDPVVGDPKILRTDGDHDTLLRTESGKLLNLTKLAQARNVDVVEYDDGKSTPSMLAELNPGKAKEETAGGLGVPEDAPARKGDAWLAWSEDDPPRSVARKQAIAQHSIDAAEQLATSEHGIGKVRQTIDRGAEAITEGLQATRDGFNDLKFACLSCSLGDADERLALRDAVEEFETNHETSLDFGNPEHIAMLYAHSERAEYRAHLEKLAPFSLSRANDRAELKTMAAELDGADHAIDQLDRTQRRLVYRMVLLELPHLKPPAGRSPEEKAATNAAIKVLQRLDDVGLLSRELLNQYTVVQPQLQRGVTPVDSQGRIQAAKCLDQCVQQTWEESPGILGLDSRMDDTAQALARHRAFTQGEPPEIADARGELAVAQRRLERALNPRYRSEPIGMSAARAGRRMPRLLVHLAGARGKLGKFANLVRGKKPDVSLLRAHVALLERKVAPYDMLHAARADRDRLIDTAPNASSGDLVSELREIRLAFADANINYWTQITKHAQLVDQLYALKAQRRSAARDLQVRELRARIDEIANPLHDVGRWFQQQHEAVDGLLGQFRNDLRSTRNPALKAAIHAEITELNGLKASIQDVQNNPDKLNRFKGLGLKAADLDRMDLKGKDAEVLAAVEQHIQSGFTNARQVKRANRRINTVRRRIVDDPEAKGILARQLEKTDQQQSNIFLNTLFRAVTRDRANFNLQADDEAVQQGFQAKLLELEENLSADAQARLEALNADLAKAQGQLRNAAARLIDHDQTTAQHVAFIRERSNVPLLGDGATATVPPEIADSFVDLRRAIRLKQMLTSEGGSAEDRNKWTAEYQQIIGRIDDGQVLNIADDRTAMDARIGKLAAADQDDDMLNLIDAVLFVSSNGPLIRAQHEGVITEQQAQIDNLVAQRSELRGPQLSGFVRDMVRGAALAARPQTLDLKFERLDSYDASQYREAIDGILQSWGMNTDQYRGEIDAVVFAARAMTETEIAAPWGAAVAHETISIVELKQWNSELESSLDDLGIRAAPVYAPELELALHTVRAMPIHAKVKLNRTWDNKLMLGWGDRDSSLGFGAAIGHNQSAVLEIKRGIKEYEIRLRSHDFGGSGTLSLPFVGLKASSTSPDGVVLHFEDAESVQAFLTKFLSDQEIKTEGWRNNSGIEEAKRDTVAVQADTGFDLGALANAGFPVGPGLIAKTSNKAERTTYRDGHRFEEKIRSEREYQVVGKVGIGYGMSVGVAAIGAGAAAWRAKTLTVVDRMKVEYSDDGRLVGAEFFRAMPLWTRQADRMIDSMGESQNLRAMLQEPVEYKGTNETFGARIQKMLDAAQPNDAFVVEYELNNRTVQAIGDLQAKQRAAATSKQRKEYEGQIKSLLLDMDNYQPKAAMLNPVRNESLTEGVELPLVSTAFERAGDIRYQAGFVPAPNKAKLDKARAEEAVDEEPIAERWRRDSIESTWSVGDIDEDRAPSGRVSVAPLEPTIDELEVKSTTRLNLNRQARPAERRPSVPVKIPGPTTRRPPPPPSVQRDWAQLMITSRAPVRFDDQNYVDGTASGLGCNCLIYSIGRLVRGRDLSATEAAGVRRSLITLGLAGESDYLANDQQTISAIIDSLGEDPNRVRIVFVTPDGHLDTNTFNEHGGRLLGLIHNLGMTHYVPMHPQD